MASAWELFTSIPTWSPSSNNPDTGHPSGCEKHRGKGFDTYIAKFDSPLLRGPHCSLCLAEKQIPFDPERHALINTYKTIYHLPQAFEYLHKMLSVAGLQLGFSEALHEKLGKFILKLNRRPLIHFFHKPFRYQPLQLPGSLMTGLERIELSTIRVMMEGLARSSSAKTAYRCLRNLRDYVENRISPEENVHGNLFTGKHSVAPLLVEIKNNDSFGTLAVRRLLLAQWPFQLDSPKCFVGPWDAISETSLRLLQRRFLVHPTLANPQDPIQTSTSAGSQNALFQDRKCLDIQSDPFPSPPEKGCAFYVLNLSDSSVVRSDIWSLFRRSRSGFSHPGPAILNPPDVQGGPPKRAPLFRSLLPQGG